MPDPMVEWTDYLRYRALFRQIDLAQIEQIVRYSQERYFDRAAGSLIAIGKCGKQLVMVPYELEENIYRPFTVHTTSRQQIEARLRSGRFTHE